MCLGLCCAVQQRPALHTTRRRQSVKAPCWTTLKGTTRTALVGHAHVCTVPALLWCNNLRRTSVYVSLCVGQLRVHCTAPHARPCVRVPCVGWHSHVTTCCDVLHGACVDASQHFAAYGQHRGWLVVCRARRRTPVCTRCGYVPTKPCPTTAATHIRARARTHTHVHTHRHRQTDRQTHRHTHTHTIMYIHTHTHTHTERETDRRLHKCLSHCDPAPWQGQCDGCARMALVVCLCEAAHTKVPKGCAFAAP